MSFAIIWKAELGLMKQVGQESVGKSTCVCVFDTIDCVAQGTATKKWAQAEIGWTSKQD